MLNATNKQTNSSRFIAVKQNVQSACTRILHTSGHIIHMTFSLLDVNAPLLFWIVWPLKCYTKQPSTVTALLTFQILNQDKIKHLVFYILIGE